MVHSNSPWGCCPPRPLHPRVPAAQPHPTLCAMSAGLCGPGAGSSRGWHLLALVTLLPPRSWDTPGPLQGLRMKMRVTATASEQSQRRGRFWLSHFCLGTHWSPGRTPWPGPGHLFSGKGRTPPAGPPTVSAAQPALLTLESEPLLRSRPQRPRVRTPRPPTAPTCVRKVTDPTCHVVQAVILP